MKVLHKKLKKVHFLKKFFYNLTLLAYIGTFIYFIYQILRLKGIEDILRYVAIGFFGVWLLLYLLIGLVTMISKKNKTFIFFTLITLLFTPVFVLSSTVINKFMNVAESINSDKIVYTTNLIVLKENKDKFDSSKPIGMIEDETDIEGNVLAKKLITKQKLTNKIYSYEDYHAMIADLYEGKIGGCFVSANYEVTFQNETFTEGDTPGSIKNKVVVKYEYSEEMKNQDTETLEKSKNKKLTEPFTVLVMGVDSAKNGLNKNQAFNGDTLILVTFNPNTLTATMFSLPRDLYVPIACNHNKYAKINSSAAYGSSCVIRTIKQLTDIDIDYYVKINFKGVVELVNALGGVEVNVEEPDFSIDGNHVGLMCEQDSNRKKGANLVCVKPGKQKLNGEQALAYSRCRHLYAESDIARNRHQQEVIAAMTKKVRKINSISEVKDILNTVSHNIETNMTPEQILSFYSVGKNMLMNSNTSEISIKKTAISYYNLRVWRGKMYTSALGYYEESLNAIVSLMKQNLGLEAPKPNYSFTFKYNEGYKEKITGRGMGGGTRLATMANRIGSNQSATSQYCISNNISCTFEYRDSAEPYGVIIDQSVHEGTLMKNVSNVTFYMSNNNLAPKNNTPQQNTEPQNNDNNQEPSGGENQGGSGSGENPSTPEEPTNPENPGEGNGE